ncbi:hypothetical protein HQ47_09530 [Porphyromonas macacae]|uniref:Uncharacterized protein n=1 Tax=Porphyromonas macacae TaxID=28115 RepID=A0A0A2E4C5_9PORP|nr:hypothetical protein HQ47_09530 [Porphyromonas macacae]
MTLPIETNRLFKIKAATFALTRQMAADTIELYKREKRLFYNHIKKQKTGFRFSWCIMIIKSLFLQGYPFTKVK